MEENNLNETNEKIEVNTSKRSEKTKRRPSVFLGILLMLIGAVITAIVMLLCFGDKIMSKDSEVADNPDTETVVNNVENKNDVEDKAPVAPANLDLNVSGSFITNLYDKIPVGYYMTAAYVEYEPRTQAAFTGNQKMLFVLDRLRWDKKYEEMSSAGIIDRLERVYGTDGNKIPTVQKYTVKDVQDLYRAIFGPKDSIYKEDIETNMGYRYEYDEKDDCFYGHPYAGGGGYGYYYSNKIDSVEKNADGTEIYIYDYYIKIEGGTKVYVAAENSNSVGEETDSEMSYYDKEKGKMYLKDEMFEKYKDKLVKYKHTFKLDTNGDYYWYSCEPTNLEKW